MDLSTITNCSEGGGGAEAVPFSDQAALSYAPGSWTATYLFGYNLSNAAGGDATAISLDLAEEEILIYLEAGESVTYLFPQPLLLSGGGFAVSGVGGTPAGVFFLDTAGTAP